MLVLSKVEQQIELLSGQIDLFPVNQNLPIARTDDQRSPKCERGPISRLLVSPKIQVDQGIGLGSANTSIYWLFHVDICAGVIKVDQFTILKMVTYGNDWNMFHDPQNAHHFQFIHSLQLQV